jgi:hypothetical protein
MQAQIKGIETQLTKINSGIARFKASSKQGGKTGNKKVKPKSKR